MSAMEVLKSGSPDKVAELLTSQDCAIRQATAVAIGGMADSVLESGSADKVAELLKSEHPGIRCAAATALGKMGEKAAKYANSLAALLNDADEDTSELYLVVGGGQARTAATSRLPKCAALMALGTVGATQHAALVADSLNDQSYEVRLVALESLALLGDAGRAEAHKIANCLEDDVFFVRSKACQVIASLKAEDQMGALPELFEDSAPLVRAAALAALAVAPSIAEGYSNEVFKCMTDEIPSVRAEAIKTLGCMGETGQSYASIIAMSLEEDDPEVRIAACEALGKLGKYGAAFAEEVEYLLRDEFPEVAEAAARALSQMGGEASASTGGFLTDA